jgi:asparagine synthase (glutamine-hydrolysing)
MCGIAGLFRRRGIDESDPRRLSAMTDSMRHRGPDDYGYLLLDSRDGSFTLGQNVLRTGRSDLLLGSRRLAVIDTSPAGRQPMTNETRDVFLVFNGEIYNYQELRRDLRARGAAASSRERQSKTRSRDLPAATMPRAT